MNGGFAFDTSADNLNDNEFNQTFTYDNGGNITSATGVGTYVYPSGTSP